MRLIDADALIDKYGDWYTEEGTEEGYIGTIKGIVDSMPTVEPERMNGKWENAGMNTYELSYGTTAYEPVYRCSACGSVTESYLRLDEPIMPEDADFPNFCPNCGCEMER